LGTQTFVPGRVRHPADPSGALHPFRNSFWLIGVQLLDGVGAGVYGALTPLVIADIMCGTGRYNLALGAIATAQGIGASLSGLVAGEIVDHFGYSAAFLALGAAAGVALIVFALRMPETAGPETVSLPSRQTDSG
jgi:MFS family permease